MLETMDLTLSFFSSVQTQARGDSSPVVELDKADKSNGRADSGIAEA